MRHNIVKSHNNLEYPYLVNYNAPEIPQSCCEGARLFSNRVEALKYWPKNARYCEVGVAYGEFADAVIRVCEPRQVKLVDRFDIPIDFDYWGKTYLADSGLTHLLYIRSKYKEDKRVTLHKGESSQVLSTFEDNSFDIIYIDAGHGYESVKEDIKQAVKKVCPGGLLVFNDYTYISPTERMDYGVYRAVNELLVAHPEYKIVYYAFGQSKMDDIAIKVIKK